LGCRSAASTPDRSWEKGDTYAEVAVEADGASGDRGVDTHAHVVVSTADVKQGASA